MPHADVKSACQELRMGYYRTRQTTALETVSMRGIKEANIISKY